MVLLDRGKCCHRKITRKNKHRNTARKNRSTSTSRELVLETSQESTEQACCEVDMCSPREYGSGVEVVRQPSLVAIDLEWRA